MKLVWQILAVVAVAAVGGQIVGGVQDNPWLSLLLGALTAVLSVFVYRWVVGRTEGRPVAELAREGARGSLYRGTVVGVALFGCVIANIALLGTTTSTASAR